jgi:multidrug efflux pump subunit AcrA (membrane-fusion protein)
MLRRLRQPIVVVPAAIVLVMVGGWWLAFRPGDDAGASSSTIRQVVPVTRGPMSETVSADGTVAAAQTDDLSFSSSGTVTAVDVKAGDTVKAGQVLATIDSAALEGDVASAKADVASAEAKLSDDQDAGASDAQITADETSLASAKDSLTSAQEALAGASLVATFDGTVASVDLTVGEHLGSTGTGGTDPTGSGTGSGNSGGNLPTGNTPGGGGGSGDDSSSSTAQIQVVSAGRYTVELSVDTSDVSRIKVGQAATVTPSASGSSRFGGGRFPGGFVFGGNNANRTGNGNAPQQQANGNGAATGATGSTTANGTVTAVSRVADASSGVATYPVTITFDSTDAAFSIGTTVTGDITVNEKQDVVQVSSLAITNTNGVSTVVVAKNGTTTGPTETRTVTTGLVSGGQTEITSGLQAGESVIISITRPGAATGGGNGGGNGFPGGGQFPGGGGGFTPPQGFQFRGGPNG